MLLGLSFSSCCVAVSWFLLKPRLLCRLVDLWFKLASQFVGFTLFTQCHGLLARFRDF